MVKKINIAFFIILFIYLIIAGFFFINGSTEGIKDNGQLNFFIALALIIVLGVFNTFGK